MSSKQMIAPTGASPIRALLGLGLLILSAFAAPGRAAIASGGFVELNTTSAVRPPLSTTTIQSLLPTRGKFTFPAPYGTTGIRLTNATDCGGAADCVNYVGYSYWRNMNNHVGSDTMLIFLGLNKARGGGGPTLFSYDKTTDVLTKVGPLFAATSAYSSHSGEGWYFSATLPTKLYMNDGARMLRYDVLAKTFETVYDATSHFGSGRYIWQMHSSNDDKVHSATLRDGSSSAMLGCLVYREDTRQFSYFARQGDFDECQIDKSGRYLVIKENVDGLDGEDNRIIDLSTGTERLLVDRAGAGGHSDLGYGTMVAADNMDYRANAVKQWNLGAGTLAGTLVYSNNSWASSVPAHVSYANAKSGVPMNQQYACGSSVNGTNTTHANEVLCFRLDGSKDVLVVAPVMTSTGASGGGDSYGKMAKGNLDVTGQYFIWTSNMGGARLDAFLVKVPSQLLMGGPADGTAPSVSISAPAGGTTVSGTVAVTANASDNVGVTGVQFKLDGANLGAEDTVAPYAVSFDSRTVGSGSHTLTAVARDAAGNTRTSAAVPVTTLGDTTPPVISAVTAAITGTSTAKVTWFTDEPGDSMVEYGVTTSYGSSTPFDGTLLTAHAATLSGLAGNTVYHYRVVSWDGAGNQAVSGDYTFTTGAVQQPNGPVLHWKLDEGAGTVAGDASGNGRSGTLANGAAWTAGAEGAALAFDGADDYVQTAPAAPLNAYPLTVAFWVKTGAAGLHALVNKYAASSMNGYQVFVNNGSLCAWYFRSASHYVWDGGACTLQAPGIADGKWHRVAFVVDAAGGRLYVDGALKASRGWTGTAGATSSGQALGLGRYPGTTAPSLPGQLDDVRIYARALSAAEIVALGGSGSGAVNWTTLVNATASGGTLAKSGGCDGCQDAGAVSVQEVGAAGGHLEFIAGTENALRYVGLSNGGTGTGAAEIDYAFRLQGAYAEVRENGVYRADTPIAAGDRLKVAVEAGTVSYYRNGALVYRSGVAPAFPLKADASLAGAGATINGAAMTAAQ